jgi:hypothetical protein
MACERPKRRPVCRAKKGENDGWREFSETLRPFARNRSVSSPAAFGLEHISNLLRALRFNFAPLRDRIFTPEA